MGCKDQPLTNAEGGIKEKVLLEKTSNKCVISVMLSLGEGVSLH